MILGLFMLAIYFIAWGLFTMVTTKHLTPPAEDDE